MPSELSERGREPPGPGQALDWRGRVSEVSGGRWVAASTRAVTRSHHFCAGECLVNYVVLY